MGLREIPQIFQIIPFIMPGLSWQFHENPFTHFSVMLSTEKQTKKQPYKPTKMKT